MIHVLGVSMPRSGHHLLEMILRNTLEHQFRYCEFYENDCCKTIPCKSPSIKQRAFDGLFLQKSHDFDFKDPIEVLGTRRVIQYRHPIPRSLSNYELHLQGGFIDNLETFRKFLVEEARYFIRFYTKWIVPHSPNFFFLTYEELTADPVKSLELFFRYLSTPVDSNLLSTGVGKSIGLRGRDNVPFSPANVSNHRYGKEPVLANFEDIIVKNCPGYYPMRYFSNNDSVNSLIGRIFYIRQAIDAGDRDRALALLALAKSEDPGDPEWHRLSEIACAISTDRAPQLGTSQNPEPLHNNVYPMATPGVDISKATKPTSGPFGYIGFHPSPEHQSRSSGGESTNETSTLTRSLNILHEETLEAELIHALYRIFLLRDPDPIGAITYSEQIKKGYSIQDIIGDFLGSSEFKKRGAYFIREWDIAQSNKYDLPLTPIKNDENLLFSVSDPASEIHDEIVWDNNYANLIFFEDKGNKSKDIKWLIVLYAAGIGATNHVLREKVKATIEAIFKEKGIKEEIFHDRFHLSPKIVERFCPELSSDLFIPADDRELDVKDIFLPGKNSLYDPDWPYPFKRGLEYDTRPGLKIYASKEADVHVHPSYYVIYNRNGRESWTSGNLQGLGKFILKYPYFHTQKDVVIVRDYFTGSNFSHFLFDAVTRIGHFCRSSETDYKNALFIFGGLPLEFHRLVLSAAERCFGITSEQCFFPKRGLNLRSERRVFWFSDQQAIIHPAQYFHPHSVEILRDLGAAIDLPSSNLRRLYVSRSDAHQRMVENESDLIHELRKLDFEIVRLKDLPILDQFTLMTGAECIVSPHGMGLTHLALRQKTVALVELFHPTIATTAYALLAKAYGFTYRSVIGDEVEGPAHNFVIDVDQVLEELRGLGIA
jgi:Glycosyltransferase 61/Domain of unknown function (DUF4214)